MKGTLKNLTKVLAICLGLFFFSWHEINAQNMNIAPDMINLNAVGNWDNIQCIYGIVLPSGYAITEHSVQLYLNGAFVTNSEVVNYCAVDDNLFVEYDRATLQGNPVVISLANAGPVVATITGYFVVTNAEGASITYMVDRWGYLEILKPGKRK
nr:hypothetical protein [Bacteroidota bacterium]